LLLKTQETIIKHILSITYKHHTSNYKSFKLIGMKRLLSTFALVSIVLTQLFAIGANPDPIEVKQPDGTTLKIMLQGDEWYNWATTTDGYRIVRNAQGVFEYAQIGNNGQIIASGHKAYAQQQRSASQAAFLAGIQKNIGINAADITKSRTISKRSALLKSASAEKTFPSVGARKLLVILVNFSDVASTYPRENFDNLLNQSNYKGTGSFKDYHLENSNGQLTISSTVTQWVTLPNTRAYYAPESKWTEFAKHAMDAANAAGVNFADFDNDGDNTVDAVAIFHVGKGQESSGDPNDIWSHSYTLSSAYSQANRLYDGVYVDGYTVQPEFNNNTTDMVNVGVLCHEFGHSLGLPDYYDTDYEVNGSQDGTGKWDIMGNGAYNNQSSTPAHHNALSKTELGWATMQTLSAQGVMQLAPIQSSLLAYRINTTTDNEYFLLENRIKTGFDSAIPGEGLIIYHVDGNRIAATRASNTINTGSHQGMYIKVASGLINSESCPFPGSANKTDFTDFSTPSSLSWAGQSTSKSVTNISVGTDKTISFNFLALENGTPVSLTATTIDHQHINIGWQPNSANTPVMLAFSTDGVFGTPDNTIDYLAGQTIVGGGTVLYFGDAQTSFAHQGLSPKSNYYYKLWSKSTTDYSTAINAIAKTTSSPVASYPWHDGFEEGLDNWQQVYELNSNNWQIRSGGYDGKPASAFAGTSNAYFFYANQTEESITKLVSPVFEAVDGEKFRLSLQHAQQKWSMDQDELRIYIKHANTTTWQLLQSYTSNIPLWKREFVDFQATGSFQLALEAKGRYGYGVVVDEVLLMRNETTTPSPGASNLALVSKTANSLTFSWTKGAGDKTMIVCREAGEVLGLPDNGQAFAASPVFQSGATLNPNDYVVYSGSESQVEITNLKIGTLYHIKAFDFFEDGLVYQTNAPTLSETTVFADVTFTFTVTDANAAPIENATVTCGNSTAQTNALGKASITMPHSFSFVVYSVTLPSFKPVWGKQTGTSNRSITIALENGEIAEPQIVETTVTGSNANIAWNPVIDENFTNYEPFALNIPNWTYVDNDKTQTFALFGAEIAFPNEAYTGAFIVMNPYVAEGLEIPTLPYSGNQFLGCVDANGRANDDWLISPQITVTGTTWLSLMAASYTDYYGLERMRILVSENGTNLSEFQPISEGNYITVPLGWNMYKYDLSAYVGKKIHFAINCVSNDAFMLMLDNIKVTNEEPVAPANSEPMLMPVNLAPKVSKPFANSISRKSASTTYTGDIRYELYRDGNTTPIAIIDGMASNAGQNAVVPCEEVEYTVKAIRKSFEVDALSQPSYLVTCLTVTINVTGNNLPIANAMVQLGTTTLLTDEQGKAVFNSTLWGNYPVTITAPGYQEFTANLEVGTRIAFNIELLEDMPTNTITTQQSVVVHPNPSSGLFHVSMAKNNSTLTYEVINAAGKKIKKGLGLNGAFTIDLGHEPNGIYLLHISTSNGLQTLKLIKTR
jgi:M6 family metalloprotease-like protein